MLTRVKSAVASFMGGIMAGSSNNNNERSGGSDLPLKYPYMRPKFLGLSADEIECSADHIARPILILKETRRLPWATGYAEVINAGKSALNEDQACCEVVLVKKKPIGSLTPRKLAASRRRSSILNSDGVGMLENNNTTGIPMHFWGVFDGHAGSGAALMASKLLQRMILERLCDVCHLLENQNNPPPICLAKNGSPFQAEAKKGACLDGEEQDGLLDEPRFHMEKDISVESLVMGIIETAFRDMDDKIEKEKESYSISGGCCALIAIHLLGKLYVANAGDSRAIIVRNNEVIPMSNEFTPESERQRLQYLGFLKPELLGNEFTHIEFPRRIQHNELGKKMLFRDHTMTGWAYKTIVEDDLKFPLIYGEGKKARVMATIGVTRGLGDHDLKVYNSNIHIKPFLSCCPEVKVYNISEHKHGADDVLIMGSDGLWDVTTDRDVADAVTTFLSGREPNDPLRYTSAAQDLLMRSRGVLKERGWRLPNERLGSGDDITVFVIPLAGAELET
ncbi:protein phosphatase 1H-like [Puntigrus tetrazona]|uniref:protein phosphatase 1H-like n=1 Tax=Puntigrus tetrazona TaxID=1606681 RepID=UPI001C8A2C1D|nr:protein phosphatase 1H-like [Puntigrus tetrazona]